MVWIAIGPNWWNEPDLVSCIAYINAPEGETLRSANTRIVENALAALGVLSPKLEHFILQTGGKVSTHNAQILFAPLILYLLTRLTVSCTNTHSRPNLSKSPMPDRNILKF